MKSSREILDQVLPFKNSKVLGVYIGVLDEFGNPFEGESVGLAFVRENRKKYRLKLFMFPQQSYFVSVDRDNPARLNILSVEDYKDNQGVEKTNWNTIGSGKLEFGNIQFSLQLYPTLNFYIPLFPNENEVETLPTKNLTKPEAA